MLRRQFLSRFSVSAAAGLAGTGFICAAGDAAAISIQPAEGGALTHLRQPAPGVDGALDWDLLAQAGESKFQDGTISRFPAALRALDGQDVTVSGYMMPFRDGKTHVEFLLGALQFHCASCMVGDLARLVAVKAAEPVAYAERPVLVRGTLRLLESEQSPLFYRLDAARSA
ncbi:MAG: hypothetical protein ACK4FK_03815 [Ferrovibrio sp.]|jgi:hypothetical protein|uniref:hypothetical protein n=1 Tax=Ferrovibrio sp. TaxID=1917215 RepID=UPI00391C20A1